MDHRGCLSLDMNAVRGRGVWKQSAIYEACRFGLVCGTWLVDLTPSYPPVVRLRFYLHRPILFFLLPLSAPVSPPPTLITVSSFCVFPSQTSMVSVEGLTKLVDPSQLTEEFDGSLDYNHEEWIELRLSLEEFFNSAVHLLSRLEDLQEMLARKEFPVDVEGSRRLIDEHTQLKKKVLKAPVEELDREGQRLLQCIRCSDGFSGRNCIPGSADFQSLVPKITSLLDKLHSTRQHLHQMWHVRKLKLDQCFQLRLFEQDAEKVREKQACCELQCGGAQLYQETVGFVDPNL